MQVSSLLKGGHPDTQGHPNIQGHLRAGLRLGWLTDTQTLLKGLFPLSQEFLLWGQEAIVLF